MDSRRRCKLDDALEGLLRCEGLRPSPLGLQGRIASRVRYVALQDEERRRFRSAWMAAAAFALSLLAFLSLTAWWLDIPALVAAQTPGVQGQIDRLAVAALQYGLPGAALALCLAAVVTAGAVLAARIRNR